MSRVEILKTYKIFINGQFPRTESGRYYPLKNKQGKLIANVCLCSRKDLKNAVVAARSAAASWASRAPFNRSQIIYRLAEMLEGRKEQFIEEIIQQGSTRAQAVKEFELSVERIVHYAGWCDKYQQLFSSVNPVSTPHFNFSVLEPMGLVVLFAEESSSLLGLLSAMLPVIAGGNTCVVLASESKPLCAITLAEVIATSDIPAGVINILTGKSSELAQHAAAHMDVNAIVYCQKDKTIQKQMEELSANNVKRFFSWYKNWQEEKSASPYLIADVQEVKTTWHPIEQIGIGGAKY